MHHPTDRITHTTAFVTPVVKHWLEWEIAQWVLPMKDRSDDPSHHEQTLYLWAMSRSLEQKCMHMQMLHKHIQNTYPANCFSSIINNWTALNNAEMFVYKPVTATRAPNVFTRVRTIFTPTYPVMENITA